METQTITDSTVQEAAPPVKMYRVTVHEIYHCYVPATSEEQAEAFTQTDTFLDNCLDNKDSEGIEVAGIVEDDTVTVEYADWDYEEIPAI